MLRGRRQIRRVYRNPWNVPAAVIVAIVFGAFMVDGVVDDLDSSRPVNVSLVSLLLLLMICARGAWARIAVSDEVVCVANFFRSYSLSWSEINHFEIGRYWLLPEVCLIYTQGGKRKCASAVNEAGYPPNGSGHEMVEALNQELDEERARRQCGHDLGATAQNTAALSGP